MEVIFIRYVAKVLYVLSSIVVCPQLNEGSCNHISVMAPARANPDEEVRFMLKVFQRTGKHLGRAWGSTLPRLAIVLRFNLSQWTIVLTKYPWFPLSVSRLCCSNVAISFWQHWKSLFVQGLDAYRFDLTYWFGDVVDAFGLAAIS